MPDRISKCQHVSQPVSDWQDKAMIELGSNKKSASNYTEAKYKQTKQSTIKTRQGVVCSLLDVFVFDICLKVQK